MTTISIPITNELNDFINEQVSIGKAGSKAELIRRAIVRYKEEEFIKSILTAKQEIRNSKGLVGDLNKLADGFE